MSDEPAKRTSWPEMNDTAGAEWRKVADEMAAQVATWRATSDRRAIFLDCYLRMTRNMFAAIDAAEFHDAVWVAQLLEHFAGYYFAALRTYEETRPATPPVWRIAHDAAGDPHTLALQNLFLGVNAHINYDLVLTLVDLLGPAWAHLDEAERLRCYADYTHVNDVIAATIDSVQDELIEPAMPALRIVDVLLGRVDEWATERLIAGWREEVWRHAVAMLETTDPVRCEEQRQAVESATVQRAAWLLAPFGGAPAA